MNFAKGSKGSNKLGSARKIGFILCSTFVLFLIFALPSISIGSNAQSNVVATKNPNFAGYLASGNATSNYFVSGVFSVFTQPTVTCDKSAPFAQGVAFSVLIIGPSGQAGSAGISALCNKGASTPTYNAILGNSISQLTVHSGDVFSVSVRINGVFVVMSLTDLSTGESIQTQLVAGNLGSVAAGCTVTKTAPARLAEFTPVSFRSCFVTINNVARGVGAYSSSVASLLKGDLTNDKVTRVIATPSPLSDGRADFTITWLHEV